MLNVATIPQPADLIDYRRLTQRRRDPTIRAIGVHISFRTDDTARSSWKQRISPRVRTTPGRGDEHAPEVLDAR
jgi:hypothetical protein